MRLHLRLALVSGLLLTGVMVLLGIWIARIAERYQAEVSQRLNASIAMYVTEELAFFGNQGVNMPALRELSRRVMTVNPSAEVYLLDARGTIVATLVPAERLQRRMVDLDAIRRFVAGAYEGPLFGDDPVDPQGEAVFSAARVADGDILLGYLYVVLGSERFDSVVGAVQGSYSLQLGIGVVAALLLITLLIAAILFARLTLPLRRLAQTIGAWSSHMGLDQAWGTASHGDEISSLTRQFETMAVRIEDQLEQIQVRDTQRRELVANISHDLRTPLAALHGYLETVLLKENLPPPTRRQFLETALRHSRQLQGLIAALFELSKLEAGFVAPEMEPFSLAELLQDIALRFKLRAQQHGVELETVADPDARPVHGDVALIERIFENLLDNALRNTPPGGCISLRMQPDHDAMTVQVRDSGYGIPQRELPQVFERHFRGAQQAGSGGGLGLAIVRRIVDLHGCRISIRSAPDAGTTVEFTLGYAA